MPFFRKEKGKIMRNRYLSPVHHFLRVSDKFFASFALHDPDLAQGPAYLYLVLFSLCRHKNHCWPSQATLARACKCSERTVQHHLARLVELDYVSVERDGIHNIYRLLLSTRVERLLAEEGVPTHAEHSETPVSNAGLPARPCASDVPKAKNLRGKGENISPHIRSSGSCLISPPPPNGADAPGTALRGRPARLVGVDASVLFQQLWDVWPVKHGLERARSVFFRLLAKGQLPDMAVLLASVERFKAEDSRWKNGYAQWLANWLACKGWLEEPFVRQQEQVASFSKPAYGALQNTPPAPDPHLAEQVRVMTERLARTQAESPVTSEEHCQNAQTLCALWPGTNSAKPVQIFLSHCQQQGKGLDMHEICSRAREYLTQAVQPMALVNWLRFEATA